MSFFDRFRGKPDNLSIKAENHPELDDDTAEGNVEPGAVANKFEAQDQSQAIETSVDSSEAKSKERMSFDEIMALGAQRAAEAQARRAETRTRWAGNIRDLKNRAVGGVKSAVGAGKAMYHAKGELASTGAEMAGEFVVNKKDQIVNNLEAGYNGIKGGIEKSVLKFNDKVEQAGGFIDNKIAQIQENRKNTKLANKLNQRLEAGRLYRKLTAEINRMKAEKADKAMPANAELSAQLA